VLAFRRSRMKKERDPTPEEFEKMLDWFNADRDLAGQKYETIRVRLTRIFISRGCIDAEILVDEVMNRVAVRIDEIVKTYVGDPARCFQGFAEKICLEYFRDLQKRYEADPPPHGVDDRSEQERQWEREREDECLTRCMGELSAADSELFRRYFQNEKRAKIDSRKRLAEELRLTANALRIKAHRIRLRLRRGMEECLDEARTS
jgi:RNA polymerase sigma factor (sigma-70 family)